MLCAIRRPLLRYVQAVAGTDAAEDLIQDVLVLIYRKLGGLQSAELFRPWAFRIASRAAFRHVKRRRERPHRIDEDALAEVPAAIAPPTLDEVTLAAMTAAVSPASRAVLMLHFQEGMTLAEVAAVLEIPIGTVRSRLSYGLDTLRQQLSDRRNHDVPGTRTDR